jgi:glycosyltransferase involved in cell wall biosynthesis
MLLSIIIPVYNVEEYLAECLNSVVNQTYPHIEIIIVNDGSTDNSEDIINQYSQQDNRIIVIEQSNKGLSAARNSGLKIASGDYILFVDSDDYIKLNACEIIVKYLLEFPYDMIVFNRYIFWGKKIVPYSTFTRYQNNYTGEEYFYDAVKSHVFAASVCYCIYKKELIRENNILFTEGILYEDLLFKFQCLMHSKHLKSTNYFLYYYRQREGSIMSTMKEKDKDVLFTVKYLESFLNEINRTNIIQNYLFKEMVYSWMLRAVCAKYPSKYPLSVPANKIVKDILYDKLFNEYVVYFAYKQNVNFKFKILAWSSLNIYPLYVLTAYLYFKIKVWI